MPSGRVGAQHLGLVAFPLCQHILVLTIGSQGQKNLIQLHLTYWHYLLVCTADLIHDKSIKKVNLVLSSVMGVRG